MKIEKSVIVERPAGELYSYWRNFENLPRIMRHVQSVEVKDGHRSHWKVAGPAGISLEWDAAIINEKENELIAWHSLEDAEIENAGTVLFIPSSSGKDTEVKVVLNYDQPGGSAGRVFAKLFGEEPSQQIQEDLNRFKTAMESRSPKAGD